MSRFLKISISAFLVVNILSSLRGLFQIHYLSKILTLLFIAVIGYEFFKNKFKPQPKQLLFLLLLLLFPAWAFITSFWSIRPDITALAAVNYIVMVLVFFGLGFLWMKYNSNENLLILFLPANIVVLGIALFSIVTGLPTDAWSGGHGRGFMGFFAHQNALAMVLLFTLPGIFALVPIVMSFRRNTIYRVTEKSESNQLFSQIDQVKSNKKKAFFFSTSRFSTLTSDVSRLTFFILLLTFNFILILLTYSRAAMLAVFIGVICYLLLNKNYKILASGLSLLAIFALLVITVKPINATVYKLLAKHNMPIFTTREILWGPSWEAAKKNFLVGTGYAMTDQTIRSGPGTGSKFDDLTGLYKREKGNSYLALIEETGIVGFTFFMIPIVYLFIYPCKRLNSYITLLNCFIAAWLCQALFETWFSVTASAFRLFLLIVIFSFFYKRITISAVNQ